MDEVELITVIEVAEKNKVVCQADSCGHSVYKKVHVVRCNDKIQILGSECFKNLYPELKKNKALYGSGNGVLLTDEERLLLLENTEALIKKFEEQYKKDDEQPEEIIYSALSDDDLYKISLVKAKEEFKKNRGLDPESAGWSGLVKSDAEIIFKELRGIELTGLRIPRAIDENGRTVPPELANEYDSYYCPSCEDKLVLKKGEGKRRVHFSHRPSDVCAQETVTHKLAKYLIIKSVNDWKAGKGPVPTIRRKCVDCESFTTQELPTNVEVAVAEKRLESGYVADIVFLSLNDILAAVEVKVSHAVDAEKKENIGLPFIEVLGQDVITKPLEWHPVTDKFRKFKCKKNQRYLL